MANVLTANDVAVAIHKATPFGRWQFVDVTFSDFDTDLVIPHDLKPSAAEQVFYTVVRQATPGSVYETGKETGAKLPTRNYIVLRSDTAGWHGRLLLTLAKSDAVGLGEFQ